MCIVLIYVIRTQKDLLRNFSAFLSFKVLFFLISHSICSLYHLSKVLRIIVNAPWFVPNRIIAHDLKLKTVKSEIRDYYVNYNKRLENHPNALANHLLTKTNTQRRLKRYTTYDLATRFN
jgi:hypothetical protein